VALRQFVAKTKFIFMQKNNKALKLFLLTFGLVLFATGGYLLYDYERIRKINQTVVTPEEADKIAENALK